MNPILQYATIVVGGTAICALGTLGTLLLCMRIQGMLDPVPHVAESKLNVQDAREMGRAVWVAEVTRQSQNRAVTFLFGAYGFLITATIAIFFLQGFHAGGFNLDTKLLMWIGAATVGEVCSLLLIALRVTWTDLIALRFPHELVALRKEAHNVPSSGIPVGG